MLCNAVSMQISRTWNGCKQNELLGQAPVLSSLIFWSLDWTWRQSVVSEPKDFTVTMHELVKVKVAVA
jgi:hypothetical protein